MTVSKTLSPKRSLSEVRASREWTVRMSARFSMIPEQLEVRVQVLARQLDHLHGLLHALQGEVLGLGGDPGAGRPPPAR